MRLKSLLKRTMISTIAGLMLLSSVSLGVSAKSIDSNEVQGNTSTVLQDKFKQWFDDGYTCWEIGSSGWFNKRAYSHMESSVRGSFWTKVVCQGNGNDTGRIYGNMWGNPAHAETEVSGEYHCHYNYD